METVTPPENTTADLMTEVKVKFEVMEEGAKKLRIYPSSLQPSIEKPSSCKILYPVLKIDGKYHYRCCVCPKVFHQLSNLKAHWRIHSGERPFKCHKCQKLFVQRAHLLKHIPTHSGERSFACTLCGKKFAKQMALANHRRLHDTRDNHECCVCGASFLEISHLMNHERRTHQSLFGIKQGFECKNCKKMYKSRSSLTLHCKRSTRCRSRWEDDLKVKKKSVKPGEKEIEVIDLSNEDEAVGIEVKDLAVPGPSSRAGPSNVVQNIQVQAQPIPAAISTQGHNENQRREHLYPNQTRPSSQDPPTYEQHVQAHYERQYQHQSYQTISTHHTQQPHAHTHAGHAQYHGSYQQQPTQILKQSLLGAAPSQEYYYYNWNCAPSQSATPTHAHATAHPIPQPAHQQYQEPQHPVFYDNGPYYQDVWYNNHHDTNMNHRSQ